MLCLTRLLRLDGLAYVRSDEVESHSQRSFEQKHCQRLIGSGARRVLIPQHELEEMLVEHLGISVAGLHGLLECLADMLGEFIGRWMVCALHMWRMPFAFASSANLSDANCGLLSLTMISRMPVLF